MAKKCLITKIIITAIFAESASTNSESPVSAQGVNRTYLIMVIMSIVQNADIENFLINFTDHQYSIKECWWYFLLLIHERMFYIITNISNVCSEIRT